MHPLALIATTRRPSTVGRLGAGDDAAQKQQLVNEASQVAQDLLSKATSAEGLAVLQATVDAFRGGMGAADIDALAQQLGGAAGVAVCSATGAGVAAAPVCGAAGAVAGSLISPFFGGGARATQSDLEDPAYAFEGSLINRKRRLETELLPKLSGTDSFPRLQELLDGYFDEPYWNGNTAASSGVNWAPPWDRPKFGGFFVAAPQTWQKIKKDDNLGSTPEDMIHIVRRTLGGLYAKGAITKQDAESYGDLFEQKIRAGSFNWTRDMEEIVAGKDPITGLFGGTGLIEENFQRAVQALFARAEMSKARNLTERLEKMQASVEGELRCSGDAACRAKAREVVAQMVKPGNTPEDTRAALDDALASPTPRSGLSTGAKVGLALGAAGGLWWANRAGYLNPIKRKLGL
jgi:hypothetical protein